MKLPQINQVYKCFTPCYSLVLRREAWTIVPMATQTDVVTHLPSDRVQSEIDTIIASIETCTLDVERKHNLDPRHERRAVNSVAKASRDSCIRAWRIQVQQSRGTAPGLGERERQTDTEACSGRKPLQRLHCGSRAPS